MHFSPGNFRGRNRCRADGLNSSSQLVYYEGEEGYCFHDSETKTDAGIRDIPMTQMVYCAFRKQREPELMPPISSHTLRHTGCTRLGENNVNPKVIQYVMGRWMSSGHPFSADRSEAKTAGCPVDIRLAPTVAKRRPLDVQWTSV